MIKERIDKMEQGIVPEGYKKTEVSLVPKEWGLKELETVSKRINVGFVGTCEKYYVDKKDGIPMLRTGNIKDQKIDLSNIKYVSNSFHEKNTKSHVKTNDLLLARHGFNGQTALYDSKFTSNCLNIILITANNYKVNSRYLYYQMNSENIKQLIMKKVGGSTQKVVNLGDIKPLKIPIPSLQEQEKIADILFTWDKAIEKIEKLIKEKDIQKKGLMQQLLTGKTRLPGFNEEWKEVKLGDVLEYEQPDKYITNNFLNEKTEEQTIPVLTANKAFILGYTDENAGIYTHIPVMIFDDFTTASKYVDFKFKIRSSAIKILKNNEKADLKFVFDRIQLIKHPMGGHKRYYISEYQFIKISLPPLDEQKAIGKILSTADKEIELLKQLLENKKQEKKGLMQLLLTGIVRV